MTMPTKLPPVVTADDYEEQSMPAFTLHYGPTPPPDEYVEAPITPAAPDDDDDYAFAEDAGDAPPPAAAASGANADDDVVMHPDEEDAVVMNQDEEEELPPLVRSPAATTVAETMRKNDHVQKKVRRVATKQTALMSHSLARVGIFGYTAKPRVHVFYPPACTQCGCPVPYTTADTTCIHPGIMFCGTPCMERFLSMPPPPMPRRPYTDVITDMRGALTSGVDRVHTFVSRTVKSWNRDHDALYDSFVGDIARKQRAADVDAEDEDDEEDAAPPADADGRVGDAKQKTTPLSAFVHMGPFYAATEQLFVPEMLGLVCASEATAADQTIVVWCGGDAEMGGATAQMFGDRVTMRAGPPSGFFGENRMSASAVVSARNAIVQQTVAVSATPVKKGKKTAADRQNSADGGTDATYDAALDALDREVIELACSLAVRVVRDRWFRILFLAPGMESLTGTPLCMMGLVAALAQCIVFRQCGRSDAVPNFWLAHRRTKSRVLAGRSAVQVATAMRLLSKMTVGDDGSAPAVDLEHLLNPLATVDVPVVIPCARRSSRTSSGEMEDKAATSAAAAADAPREHRGGGSPSVSVQGRALSNLFGTWIMGPADWPVPPESQPHSVSGSVDTSATPESQPVHPRRHHRRHHHHHVQPEACSHDTQGSPATHPPPPAATHGDAGTIDDDQPPPLVMAPAT